MKKNAVVTLLVSIVLLSLMDFFAEKNILVGMKSNIVWLIFMIGLFYSAITICTDFHFESQYFKYVFYTFLAYQFIILIRGVFHTDDFLSIIKQGPILWALFIPFLVFFDKSLYHFRKIFDVLYAFGVFFIILNIINPTLLINRQNAEATIPTFAIGGGFLLLNAIYLKNRRVNVAFLVLLLSALSYTYLARRSAAFTLYAFLFVGSVFNILNKSGKSIFKILPVLVIGGAFFFLVPNSLSSAFLKKMDERLLEDTRTALFDEFYIEMDNDMIFGKGMNGTYYYPLDATVQDDGTIYGAETYRNIIENGYLQLLLSGGILHIVLFVLLLLPASILGIFNSSNILSKACGIMIFLWLIDMFMYGLPTLSIHYALIWISAGFCFKKSLRAKTDNEIFIGLNKNYYETFYPEKFIETSSHK